MPDPILCYWSSAEPGLFKEAGRWCSSSATSENITGTGRKKNLTDLQSISVSGAVDAKNLSPRLLKGSLKGGLKAPSTSLC